MANISFLKEEKEEEKIPSLNLSFGVPKEMKKKNISRAVKKARLS